MDGIVAVYSDWGIGSGGTQPIVIPEDRKHFVELTRGATVIAGRKTLEDFPGGAPLKNRVNIILTRQEMEIEGADVVHNVDEVLEIANNYEKVFVLGGASVYVETFPHLDRVFVTKIGATPHSDAFFPNLDKHPDWQLTDAGEPFMSGDMECSFCTYERIK